MSELPLRHLSEDDMYYLATNFEVAPVGHPDDSQAQAVHAVDENIVELDSAEWTLDEVNARVESLARRFGLRVKTILRNEPGAAAFVGRGGGVIQLSARRTPGTYRLVEPGNHLASIVLHEMAHVLTPQLWDRPHRYPSPEFQSHGPEFVGTYLALLDGHVDTNKVREAHSLVGVRELRVTDAAIWSFAGLRTEKEAIRDGA